MIWVGHMACMEEKRNLCKIFSSENLKGGDHSQYLGMDKRIILK
jgi:hypothetical protein